MNVCQPEPEFLKATFISSSATCAKFYDSSTVHFILSLKRFIVFICLIYNFICAQ